MTAQLAPVPIFKGFDGLGQPLAFGFLGTFQAGTLIPQATYKDSTQTTPNTNPIQLNFRGECALWLDPALIYKFTLTDVLGNNIPGYPVDNIPGGFGSGPLSVSLIPNPTNTFTLGNSTHTWANVFVGPNGASVLDTVSGNIGYIQRTAAEILASVTPTAYFYPEGDARRYNALTTAADNSASFNAALLVSSNGGSAAFVPPSVAGYKHTSTLTAPSGSCMYGAGQASQLLPQSCDGITFGAQTGIAKSRFFRDFQILGSATGSNNGIIVNFTAASGSIVTGIEFDNLTIQNFGQGVFSRGLWQSQFRNCFLYNNYQGYYFHGQSVFNTIEGGFVQKGSIAGTGNRIGINVDSVAGETCQSLHCIAAAVYGYDVLFASGPALYTVLENCDLSVATQIGVQLGANIGGFTMRDCWIQTNNAGFATVGIQLADLGSAVADKIVIDNCTLVCNLANAGSQGIYVGTNQQAVTITNCTIGSATAPFATGIISNGFAHNLRAKFNTIYASTTAIQLSSSGIDPEIGPNTIQNGTPLVFTAATPAGFSYYARGSFTITLTGMTGTVTGTINWVANGHMVTLSVATAGISGTSNATSMTGTGLPASLWPVTDQWSMTNVEDSGIGSLGILRVAAATGLITFTKDGAGNLFTNTGAKGLFGFNFSWPYL